jgi:hypothetical protein
MSPNTLHLILGIMNHHNDYFMYSIHNVVKDEVPTQLVEEPSTDMMCIWWMTFHSWMIFPNDV